MEEPARKPTQGASGSEAEEVTRGQYQALLDLARSLVSELDLEAVLRQVLTAGRDLTGARYAAIGILDEDKRELERFVYVGIDEATRERIGDLPRGRGILGELIRNPVPLRLDDVSAHPRSYGFPHGHPPMRTFIGVPVVIRGEAWGNLYLTEKDGGESFDEADEQLATLLSQWAAIAIENARLYQRLERRGEERAQVLRALEAGVEISRAAGRGASLQDLLELVAKRARDLLEARVVAVVQSTDQGPKVVAAAGEGCEGIIGRELDLHRPIFADALQLRGGGRVSSASGRLIEFDELGMVAESALIAPLEFRNRPNGMLLALDSLEALGFGPHDEVALTSFAANAASAIVTAGAVEAEQLRRAIKAADSERARWARELHDETLQELAALRLVLESGVARGAAEQVSEAASHTVEGLDTAIRNLQGLLTELRPAALDELGVGPALESLADRASAASGVDVELELRLGHERERLDPDLESTIYRLVQESVNNAIKHGAPGSIRASVAQRDDVIAIRVEDDGDGFDPDSVEHGFGLVGMDERVRLENGSLRIESKQGAGTTVYAELPLPAG